VQQHKPPKVNSLPSIAPVDAHERLRDYLTEAACLVLLQGTRHARYPWRNAAMLMLTCYHGLRVSELCHLRRQDVELHHGRIWIARRKGSLSTEQPRLTEELRSLKRDLKQRSDSQLLWLFLTERGDQFTRFSINDCYAMAAAMPWRTVATSCASFKISWGIGTPNTPRAILAQPPTALPACGSEPGDTTRGHVTPSRPKPSRIGGDGWGRGRRGAPSGGASSKRRRPSRACPHPRATASCASPATPMPWGARTGVCPASYPPPPWNAIWR
jgi:hypothetical protein